MYISLFFSTLLITNLGKNTMNRHNLMDRIFCNTLDLQHKFQIWFSVGSTFLFHQQGKKNCGLLRLSHFVRKWKTFIFYFFFHSSGNLTNRIVWTLLTEVVIFVVTIVLAMVDSSEWSGIFFYLTIGSVIILNSMFFYIVMVLSLVSLLF